MKAKTFPRTLRQAVTYFRDPDEARWLLAQLRWPEGITCPSCGSFEISDLTTRAVFCCRLCRRQFTVKSGTIFEDSPIGLHQWLCAVWALSSREHAASSHELARRIHVTQKTAWFMLSRIRLAMQTKGFNALPRSGRRRPRNNRLWRKGSSM